MFFPNPEDGNPVLTRHFDRIVPLAVLDEDRGPLAFGDDEIRAKVTLIGGVHSRESNQITLRGVVVGPIE